MFDEFALDDATYDRFLAFASERGVAVVAERPADADDPVLVRPEVDAVRGDVETRVRAFMARRLFGADAFYPVIGALDPTLQEVTRLWGNAETLAARR